MLIRRLPFQILTCLLAVFFLSGCFTVEQQTRWKAERAAAQQEKERENKVAPLRESNRVAYAEFRARKGWKSKTFRDKNVVALVGSAPFRIKIVTGSQRGLVLVKDLVALDFPVATGRKSHPTPFGDFKILAKEKVHRSNLYGKIVDAAGNVVVSDADTRVHQPTEDASFEGAPMPFFMRLTWTGVGLHVGRVPGYAVSHGCIRVPKALGPELYALAPVDTPVEIVASE